MRFLHLADLHIGKKLNDYPLYEDQKHVFAQAFDLAQKENVDAIVIAGDVYDSGAPSAEAMEAYDDFLSSLYALGKPILMISGNHDSSERLHVAAGILKRNAIHIVTKIEDAMTPVTIGDTNFYLLPFFRPSEVNRLYDQDFHSYAEAMRFLIEKMDVDKTKQNVLVTHQAILPVSAKLESSGSETALDIDGDGSVGGSEIIGVRLFDDFDYLALGHIHKSQNVSAKARYAGAMLKYNTKEVNQTRELTVVSLKNKALSIQTFPLVPLHDLVIVEGSLEEVLAIEGHESDYVHVRLTEGIFVDSPQAKLKAKFPFYLSMELPRQRNSHNEIEVEHVETKTPEELFEIFFEKYGGKELDEEEADLVHRLLEAGKEAQ